MQTPVAEGICCHHSDAQVGVVATAGAAAGPRILVPPGRHLLTTLAFKHVISGEAS